MLSRIAYIVSVILLCCASFFYYPRWQQPATEAAISWDVSGYYWYLPSMFIYKDIKHIAFKDSILNKYLPTNTDLQQAMLLDNGNYVMKYSSGMAVMYLPFFTAAHLVAGALGYPRDGFSAPYQFAIQFAGLLISIIGLWYLRKLLLLYYADKVVAITLFLLACGTNYFNYAAIDCGMSHTWLFTIYVFLVLNTHYFYQQFQFKYAIRIGFLIGLATLTRPTEVISCVIPVLWGLDAVSISAIKKQFSLLLSQYKKLLIAAVVAACVISLQLVYWKYVSGHWLVYSYGDQGFFWTRPHVFLYSFNYRTGWLTYCPMMLLAIIGIVPLLKYGKHKWAIVCFLLLNYYIVSAWDIWWYGGRAMVQSYALFAFPFAALVDFVLRRKVLSWLFFAVAALFFYFGVWIFIQYHTGGLYDGETMSKEYFNRVVGRWTVPVQTKALLDGPDCFEGAPLNEHLLFEETYDTCSGAVYIPGAEGIGKAIVLNTTNQFTPFIRIPFKNGKAKWIRAEATIAFAQKEWNIWNMPTMSLRLDIGEEYVKENVVRIGRFLNDGDRKVVVLDMKLPERLYSRITFVIWNKNTDKEIVVDNIKIFEFEE